MKLVYFFRSLITLLLIFQRCFALTPVVIRQCVESTQPSAKDVALLYGTEFNIVSTPAKCFFVCLFETPGFVTSDGQLTEDIIIMARTLKEVEKFQSARIECSNSEEGECEASYQAVKCWLSFLRAKNKTKPAEHNLK